MFTKISFLCEKYYRANTKFDLTLFAVPGWKQLGPWEQELAMFVASFFYYCDYSNAKRCNPGSMIWGAECRGPAVSSLYWTVCGPASI